jgi:hypothetical protein
MSDVPAVTPSRAQAAATPVASPASAVPPASRARAGFRLFLSELNPLQYIPVIGTLYRAATGDTIPERARLVGSFVVSGLEGGPIGLAINAAVTAAEKLTGIDPEKMGRKVLADLGIGARAPAAAAPTTPASARQQVTAAAAAQPPGASAAVPWSPAQLTAYGVTVAANGDVSRGALHGGDVLNELELARLRPTGLAAVV